MEEKTKQLRNFFDNKGLTQEMVAETLGVDKAHVNKLMNGKKQFGKQTAKKWSDLFGLSYTWLLTGEGDMVHAESNSESSTNVSYTMYKDLLDRYESVLRENERLLIKLSAYEK